MEKITYPCLAPAFKQYLEDEALGEKTIDDYMNNVRRYNEWCVASFGSEPPGLFHSNLVDFKSYLVIHKNHQNATINAYLSALAAYNKFLLVAKGHQRVLSSLVVAAMFASHSDTRTTKRYTRPSREEMKEKLNKCRWHHTE